jgi:HlyD family secretion protein
MIKNWLSVCALGVAAACQRSAADAPNTYQGVVEFEETVLAFESGGRIERVWVDEGDRLLAGAPVAELDDQLLRATRAARLLEAEVQRSQAKLVGASARSEDIAALSARVRGARANEELLVKNLAREQALLAQGVVPAASVEDLAARVAQARAEREAAEAELSSLRRGARTEERATASARAEAAEAQVTLEDDRLQRSLLHAPIAGRVLDRHVEPGEVIAAGAPIVTLGDTRRPYADVFVPQAELAGISVGTRALLGVDAQSTRFAGRVEHVSRRTEFTPRFVFSERERPNLVVRVRVRIDDPNERLHAGVPAFVEIQRAPADGKQP